VFSTWTFRIAALLRAYWFKKDPIIVFANFLLFGVGTQ